jgi:putative acetyltransferase
MPAATIPPGLVLRRAVPDDAEAIARLNGAAEVFGNLLQLPYPNVAAMRTRLAEQAGAGHTDLQLVACEGNEVLGCAGLHPAAPALRRRHAMMLGIAVRATAQRRGVGSALMQALIDYADGWGQVLRIELTVFSDNAGAVRLYERFGFRHEGTHRGYALRDGAYADVLSMARLHPHPPVPAWPEA